MFNPLILPALLSGSVVDSHDWVACSSTSATLFEGTQAIGEWKDQLLDRLGTTCSVVIRNGYGDKSIIEGTITGVRVFLPANADAAQLSILRSVTHIVDHQLGYFELQGTDKEAFSELLTNVPEAFHIEPVCTLPPPEKPRKMGRSCKAPSPVPYSTAELTEDGRSLLHSLGVDALWGRGVTTSSALIAVLGSGYDVCHPDLAPNTVENCDGTVAGYDALWSEDPRAWEDTAHDTMVAQVLGAAGNGEQALGLLHEARLLPVRIKGGRDDRLASTQGIIDAFKYMAKRGVDLVVMPFTIEFDPANRLMRCITEQFPATIVVSAPDEGGPNLDTVPADIFPLRARSVLVVAGHQNGVYEDVYGKETISIATEYRGTFTGVPTGTSNSAAYFAGAAALLAECRGITVRDAASALMNHAGEMCGCPRPHCGPGLGACCNQAGGSLDISVTLERIGPGCQAPSSPHSFVP